MQASQKITTSTEGLKGLWMAITGNCSLRNV